MSDDLRKLAEAARDDELVRRVADRALSWGPSEWPGEKIGEYCASAPTLARQALRLLDERDRLKQRLIRVTAEPHASNCPYYRDACNCHIGIAERALGDPNAE